MICVAVENDADAAESGDVLPMIVFTGFTLAGNCAGLARLANQHDNNNSNMALLGPFSIIVECWKKTNPEAMESQSKDTRKRIFRFEILPPAPKRSGSLTDLARQSNNYFDWRLSEKKFVLLHQR